MQKNAKSIFRGTLPHRQQKNRQTGAEILWVIARKCHVSGSGVRFIYLPHCWLKSKSKSQPKKIKTRQTLLSISMWGMACMMACRLQSLAKGAGGRCCHRHQLLQTVQTILIAFLQYVLLRLDVLMCPGHIESNELFGFCGNVAYLQAFCIICCINVSL